MKDTEQLAVSSPSGAHAMVCFGKPHGEPVYQHGTNVD
jgi:hypothetical protein